MKRKEQVILCLASAILIVGLGRSLTKPVGSTTKQVDNSPRFQVSEREERMARILNNDLSFIERVQSIRQLPLKVEDQDLLKLLAYLEAPLPEAGRGEALVSLNEVMEELRLKGRDSHEYGNCLARIMLSPTSDEVVRDYAVQHAIGWMIDSERMSNMPSNDRSTPADRELLLGAIASILDEANVQQGSAWGTTLNALRDFKQRTDHPTEVSGLFEAKRDLIRAVAIGEQKSYIGNRVSAIQALGELADRVEALRITRELANDETTPMSSRLAAIAGLGMIGTAMDRTRLEALALQDRRLKYAAQSAATRFDQRPHDEVSVRER